MGFVARKEEIQKLSRNFSSDKFSFSLIYGRRRVGKSELVKRVLKDCDAFKVYYECKEISEEGNALGLSQIIAEQLGLPKFSFNGIEDALRYVFELSKTRKAILILDEYPYLRSSVPGMDSILQSLIDNYRGEAKLSIVILGSYVDTMRSLLLHSNPLYGRVDLSLELKPMDYYDSSLFYPSFSDEDKIRLYSVFGGIPYYNSLIDENLTVEENIVNLIASPSSRLENEVLFYLHSGIGKITNANEVFNALSEGYSRFSDILSQSHASSSPALADVLNKLLGMGVVCKIAPINDASNKRKMGYYIADNLSLFYYKYLFRYSSQMQVMDPRLFYKRYIEKDFEEQYVPHAFEKVCQQYLIRQNKRSLIDPCFDKIGKYYYDDPVSHSNGEFDIVTEDPEGYVFYEAKFKKSKISAQDIEEEIRQVERTGLKCHRYVFISRSGFACSAQQHVEFIDLSSLYKE